jgi:hypothetical protein
MLVFSPAPHAEFYKTCLTLLIRRASANCLLPIHYRNLSQLVSELFRSCFSCFTPKNNIYQFFFQKMVESFFVYLGLELEGAATHLCAN